MRAELNVKEVLVPKGAGTRLQSSTKSMLKGLLPEARFALQRATCWEHEHALRALKQDTLFAPPLPDYLAALLNNPDSHSASLSALAGMVSYLQRSLLDKAVLSVGEVLPLDTRRRHSTTPSAADLARDGGLAETPSLQQSVALDASAFSNLNARLLLHPPTFSFCGLAAVPHACLSCVRHCILRSSSSLVCSCRFIHMQSF
jgi:hypothetical protein